MEFLDIASPPEIGQFQIGCIKYKKATKVDLQNLSVRDLNPCLVGLH